MLDKKIGFLGCGNMAKAMLKGLISSQLVKAANIFVFDRKPETNQQLAKQFGVTASQDMSQLASSVDILIVAVKPNVISKVLTEIKAALQPNALVVSVAAGVTLGTLAEALGDSRKIVRVMPNTPALVGEGMSSVTPNDNVSSEETEEVVALFQSFGRAEVVSEYLIHSVVGVSGSAPAYIFLLIEAMADAAVLGGMPREKAYQFAAQTVKGSAQMVLETGEHPAVLKDQVCSPGGTTIEAVKTLEDQRFRAAIINAMQDCMSKSRQLSGEQ